MDLSQSQLDSDDHSTQYANGVNPKSPVVRGARACTVCRAAKMKCVGGTESGEKCQRCKRANAQCVFEKHRRGRKPGSKLSEASKMLRKLEKGLNNAKLKSQTADASLSPQFSSPDSRSGQTGDGHLRLGLGHVSTGPPGSHQIDRELPPIQFRGRYDSLNPRTDYDNDVDENTIEQDQDDDGDIEKQADGMYPAKLINKENQRNSFFGTVLGPSSSSAGGPRSATVSSSQSDRSSVYSSGHAPRSSPVISRPSITDPISANLIDEDTAKILFDFVFLRLNTFINLFDPELHSVSYVRKKCPLLFTTLLMAGSKYWKPEVYRQCYELAHTLAVRAFAESWKRVEVVQAFACLTYWREPDDTRTWMYIGYACRMAIELGLNRYCAKPPDRETDLQRLERRNRERTYLVLFVHDRSLSMQTGRQWMLKEDELVRQSSTWHEQVSTGVAIRPEDVILGALVQLRRIAGERAELFDMQKGAPGSSHSDVDFEVLLRGCNANLKQWGATWEQEMKRANGHMFHFSFIQFFCLHVRLFLNSYGVQASLSNTSRQSPSLQALTTCYTSAVDSLRIITNEFAPVQVLQYSQDSVTIMTAYSAVFLLRLLRSPNTSVELHEGATNEIYTLISKTADAYQEAAAMATSSTSSASHARFLRSLVERDKLRARQMERDRLDNVAIDPVLQTDQLPYLRYRSSASRTSQGSAGPLLNHSGPQSLSNYHYTSPGIMSESSFRGHHSISSENGISDIHRGSIHSMNDTSTSSAVDDAHYFRNMWRELDPAFGGDTEMGFNTQYSYLAFGTG